MLSSIISFVSTELIISSWFSLESGIESRYVILSSSLDAMLREKSLPAILISIPRTSLSLTSKKSAIFFKSSFVNSSCEMLSSLFAFPML